jgi:mannosyl-oligosaccharide alpha-1,2-mannosidase
MAWDLFLGINQSTRSEFGFSHVRNVDSINPSKVNNQESFFIAETLKYLYLTFADSNVINPNECVFNPGAHPFKIIPKEVAKTWIKYLPKTTKGKI